MKTLKPIYDRDQYTEWVLDEMFAVIYTAVFEPLFDIMKIKIREHSTASLIRSLETGRVTYRSGKIIGPFTASISKDLKSIGARFIKSDKTWAISWANIPDNVRTAIATNVEKMDNIQRMIDAKIAHAERIKEKLTVDFDPAASRVLSELRTQAAKNVEIGINPEISNAEMTRIRRDYTDTLNKYFREQIDETVYRVRDQFESLTLAGFRSESMVDELQSQYRIARSKAKFLARQTTAVMVSAYRKSHYKDAGVNEYKWSTSRDSRVRPDHKALDGRIFSWDNPPVTDTATGARNHPGEDWLCRCVAIPVLREWGMKK